MRSQRRCEAKGVSTRKHPISNHNILYTLIKYASDMFAFMTVCWVTWKNIISLRHFGTREGKYFKFQLGLFRLYVAREVRKSDEYIVL